MTRAADLSHAFIRPDWLAASAEDALDPGQPIVDAHHHLFDRPGARYLLDDYLADVRSGHDVRSTVFVQARTMYRSSGPELTRAVGETEFANGVRAMCVGGYSPVRVCDGIVAYADLDRGEAVRPVLEAHLAASGGNLRGIRHIACWDVEGALLNAAYPTSEAMLESPRFRAGFAELGRLGLSFDAWLFHHQIPRLAALARACPEVSVVLDHCGGVLGAGPYAGRQDEVFATWLEGVRDLARCRNVMVKLGGLGMRLSGFGFEAGETAPPSTRLAEAWRPWMERCIELFGAARCMFESNFPIDKGGYAYVNGWNAMKRIASGASAEEKADLFWRSAARFYCLPEPSLTHGCGGTAHQGRHGRSAETCSI